MDSRNKAILEAFEESFLSPTHRRAHSLTWRNEERVCTKCLKPFLARVATIDGEDHQPIQECPECLQALFRADDEANAALKLRVATFTRRDEWRRFCGMQRDLWGWTFDTFKVERQPRAFALAKGHRLDSSLVLYSYPNKKPRKGEEYSDGYGLGKSHLLAAMANRLLETETPARLCQGYYIQTLACPLYWATEPDLLARITNTYQEGAGETEAIVFNQLTSVRYLFIDDAAKYQPKDPGFVQRVYYRIINTRAISRKPIFMTANLSLENLEEYIGGASADRLRGMCGKRGFMMLTGESFRRQE